MRYLKIFIYLIILSPLCVKGLVCDNTTKVRLQTLAQNITTSYDYVEQNGTVTFNITFLNLNSELYLVDTVNEKDIYYSDTSLTLNGFESGKNYKFEVRSTDPFCSRSVLYYIYVTTPYFNPYYNDPICEGVSYKYCNKWQKNDLSYDEFIEYNFKRIFKYRNPIEEDEYYIIKDEIKYSTKYYGENHEYTTYHKMDLFKFKEKLVDKYLYDPYQCKSFSNPDKTGL